MKLLDDPLQKRYRGVWGMFLSVRVSWAGFPWRMGDSAESFLTLVTSYTASHCGALGGKRGNAAGSACSRPRFAHVQGWALPAGGRRGQWAGRLSRLWPMLPRFGYEFRCQGERRCQAGWQWSAPGTGVSSPAAGERGPGVTGPRDRPSRGPPCVWGYLRPDPAPR